MKPLRILPYGPSDTIKLLVAELKARGVNVKLIKKTGSTYRGNRDHVVLNWGSTDRSSVRPDFSIFNTPEYIGNASSKITTFNTLKHNMASNIPRFTEDIEQAKEWVREGLIVYCRTLTRSSQGRGIVVARTLEEVVSAPLYTVKCPRNREMRVHVFNGEVIDFIQKKKMSEETLIERNMTCSNDVRNHGNGWVFARDNITLPEEAKEVAIKAVKELGLDFGGVDLAISLGPVRVFEVNTAPGLEGTSLNKYCDAIVKLLDN